MTTFKLIFITGGLILFFPVVIYLLFIPVFQRVRIRWNHMFKFYHDVCFLFIVEPKGFCLLQKLALQEITVIKNDHLITHIIQICNRHKILHATFLAMIETILEFRLPGLWQYPHSCCIFFHQLHKIAFPYILGRKNMQHCIKTTKISQIGQEKIQWIFFSPVFFFRTYFKIVTSDTDKIVRQEPFRAANDKTTESKDKNTFILNKCQRQNSSGDHEQTTDNDQCFIPDIYLKKAICIIHKMIFLCIFFIKDNIIHAKFKHFGKGANHGTV